MFSPQTMETMDRALRVGTVKRSELGDDWTAEAHVAPPRNRVRFPDVLVQLSGQDGNGFFIVSHVRMELERWLRECGNTRAEASEVGLEFFEEATSGDYDHLLQTVMKWVTVE